MVKGSAATIDESTNARELEFWMKEYDLSTSLFMKAIDLYMRMFVVYIGIVGLLLKFALDSSATTELRRTMLLFALACCVLLYLVIIGAEMVFRKLKEKRRCALQAIGKETQHAYMASRLGSIAFGLFNTGVVVLILTML